MIFSFNLTGIHIISNKDCDCPCQPDTLTKATKQKRTVQDSEKNVWGLNVELNKKVNSGKYDCKAQGRNSLCISESGQQTLCYTSGIGGLIHRVWGGVQVQKPLGLVQIQIFQQGPPLGSTMYVFKKYKIFIKLSRITHLSDALIFQRCWLWGLTNLNEPNFFEVRQTSNLKVQVQQTL